MKVKPPMGQGRVRLIRIGEIGPLRLGKIEKKGAINRRVALLFA